MKTNLTFMAMLLIAVAFCFGINSCGNNEDDDSQEDVLTNGDNSSSMLDMTIINKLKGTSWKWIKTEKFRNGKLSNTINGDNSVIKFSDEKESGSDTLFIIYVNGKKNGAYWPSEESDGYPRIGTYWNEAKYGTYFGYFINIFKLTSSELVMGQVDSRRTYFVAATGSSSGGTSSGSAPTFRDFSYTYTQNSITLQYLTKDNNTTKAIVYYGKTTTPSTSVSTSVSGGHIITARITGLTKATKYYVKCVATNNYGSTTSDVVSVMTGSN